MITVAIDCRELSSVSFGIGRFVKGVIDHIAVHNTGYRFLLLVNHDYDRGLDTLPDCSVLLLPQAGFRLLTDQWLIPRALNRRRADLFYSPYYKVPVFGSFKKIGMIHDLNIIKPEVGYPWWKRMLYLGLLRFFSRRMDAVVTDSDYSKQDIVTRLGIPHNRITVIPIPLEKIFTRPAPVVNKDILLFVGTVLPHKNVEFLLKVYAALPASIRVRYPLVIAGRVEKRYRRRLEHQAAAAGLSDSEYSFTGYIADDELFSLYSRAELLIFPSLLEGFGVPVIEAQAMGVPVICSNRASLPEIAGEGGTRAAAVILDPVVPPVWAKAISELIASPEQKNELIQNGFVNIKRFENRLIFARFFRLIHDTAGE